MTKYIILLLILFRIILPQNLPFNYYLTEELKFRKSSQIYPTQIGNSISDILTSADTILLGTNKGLSISFNKGESWNNYFNDDVFGSESISGLAFHNGLIVAATAHSVEKDNQVLPVGSGIKISTDGGKTWKSVDQPIDHLDSNKVYYGKNVLRALPITTTINNITYDIAITKNTIWITSFAGGLRKSTNYGDTWERVVLPSDSLNKIKPEDSLNFDLSPSSGALGYQSNLNHRVFSVYAQNDSTLWVGTANGINLSTDNGISWKKFNHQNQTNSMSGNFIVAINGTKILDKNYVIAATWKAEAQSEFYALSYTTDDGNNWSTAKKEEKFYNFGFSGKVIFAAGTDGLYRSEDFGANWTKAPQIIDAITKQRLFTSTFYAVDGQYPDIIWVGSNEGLARTTENGFPWAGTWRIFKFFVPVGSKNETYAFPNPFNPDKERIEIKYTTAGIDAKVTIRVYNFSFELVRTIVQNAPRFGAVDKLIQQSETWDGKDESGNYVSNGVYFYSVEINDEKPLFGKIIVLR